MPLTIEEINQEVESMENDAKALKEELFRLCWFMRGSVNLSEIYDLPIEDRDIITKVIKDNLETTKESGMPFF